MKPPFQCHLLSLCISVAGPGISLLKHLNESRKMRETEARQSNYHCTPSATQAFPSYRSRRHISCCLAMTKRHHPLAELLSIVLVNLPFLPSLVPPRKVVSLQRLLAFSAICRAVLSPWCCACCPALQSALQWPQDSRNDDRENLSKLSGAP